MCDASCNICGTNLSTSFQTSAKHVGTFILKFVCVFVCVCGLVCQCTCVVCICVAVLAVSYVVVDPLSWHSYTSDQQKTDESQHVSVSAQRPADSHFPGNTQTLTHTHTHTLITQISSLRW